MKEKRYKDILHKKYEDFRLEEHQQKKKLLQTEIHSILNKLEVPDSEDFYIWGLSLYFSDEDKDYNTNLALEKLLKSFQLNSNNFLACLYIAHCFQDKKDFQNALDYYEKVNQKELKEFQTWRYVKLIEQIGYCHFKLGRKKIGRKRFEEVLTWYKKSEISELAIPTELIECLDESDQIVKEIKEIEDYL